MEKKIVFSIAAALMVSAAVFAAEPGGNDPSGYAAHTFQAGNGIELPYRVLLPENYDEGKEYPLVLFLHGAGERGDDNTKQLVHGSGMFDNPVNREKYPAVVLFPQCPQELYWAFGRRPQGGFALDTFPSEYPATPILSAVKELVDSYLAAGKIDPSRVYIMGLSMGGMGTFDMVCRWPGMFAAAVPICGGVGTERLRSAVGVPMRIFHGDADNTVPVENSRAAYRALKAYGGKVEYIEFPGVEHNSWNPAFNLPDFMEWVFSQRK